MNQLNKHYGVDVSEHNGIVNWQEVRDAGIEFAIIRLGYGRGHLDSQFYHLMPERCLECGHKHWRILLFLCAKLQ